MAAKVGRTGPGEHNPWPTRLISAPRTGPCSSLLIAHSFFCDYLEPFVFDLHGNHPFIFVHSLAFPFEVVCVCVISPMLPSSNSAVGIASCSRHPGHCRSVPDFSSGAHSPPAAAPTLQPSGACSFCWNPRTPLVKAQPRLPLLSRPGHLVLVEQGLAFTVFPNAWSHL